MSELLTTSKTKRLLALLRDGEKGFRELSKQVSDADCREFLLQESHLRGAFADQLERATAQPSETEQQAGTGLGTCHRRWTAMKATLGAGDYALLETTEICEWFAVKAYADVLRDQSLNPAIRALVADQAKSVYQSRELVHEFRRGTRK